MFQKLFPLLAIGIWGVVVLPLSEVASATTPLTRAEIQDLRNLVQLILKKNSVKRPARKSDAMIPGDGLSTGRASLADLRFNDGSLARVGEQAVFHFLPRTRNFRLTNGTVLLLIPPGRGQTRIQTPNAAAAIRGSALFVRYDEQTDTTIVGALTDSGIEVSNKQASQSQVLEAGQLMVIVKGKFQGLYDFDLRNFYETSDLVRGLDLTRQNITPTPDPAIASVQAETAAAVATQTPIKGEGVLENPSFLQLTASSSNSPSQGNSNSINQENSQDNSQEDSQGNAQENSSLNPIPDNLSVDSLVDTGQVQFNEQLGNGETSPTPQIPSSTPSETVTPPKPDVVTPPKPDVVTPPKPDVVTPPKPDVVTPPKPDVVTPPKPDVVTPPKPDVVTPPKPDVVTPPKPDVVTPPKPDVVTPPKPDVVTPPKPDVVTPPKPDVVEPPKPDVVTPPKPDVVTPPKPDVVEPPKPDVVTPPKPDVVEPPKPDVVTPPKPDVVTPPKPDVVTPPKPDVVEPPKPDVVTPPKPDVVEPPKPDVEPPTRPTS